MGQVGVMEVQVVRSLVGGFKDRKIFLVEMSIAPVPLVQGEEEGIVRIVRVEDEHSAKIEKVIARNDGQVGIQEVIALVIQNRFDRGEDLRELRDGFLDAATDGDHR